MTLAVSVLAFFEFVQNISALSAVLLILGLILLIIEATIPGFGVAGGLGILFCLIGIFLTARTPMDFLAMIAILVGLVGLLLIWIWRSAKKGFVNRKLILKSAANRQDGYSAVTDHSNLIGQTGVATSVLRPAGTAEIDNKRWDVVTDGAFLPAGTHVKVVSVSGRRIVVEATDS